MPDAVAPLLRLNLGCGHRKLAGFVNVDKFAACGPDAVVDLECFPWPWAEGSVGDIQPGMPLEAFLRTRERNAIGYLVDPIRMSLARAFKER